MDLIPAKKALKARRVTEDSYCPNCECDVEDTLHALVHCLMPVSVWREASEGYMQNATTTFATWYMCSTNDLDKLQEKAVVSCEISNNRNLWLWNNVRERGDVVYSSAMALLQDWRLA